jgi:hypothetical protein
MMSRSRLVFALSFASVLVALAPHSADAQKRQRDRITREEIESSPHKNLDAFQLIRNLRPHFLEAPKGVRSFGNSTTPYLPIVLYVDGRKDTGLDALRVMDPNTIEEIRYLEPTRAENEFGPQAANGAVVVKLRKIKTQQAPPPSPDTTLGKR